LDRGGRTHAQACEEQLRLQATLQAVGGSIAEGAASPFEPFCEAWRRPLAAGVSDIDVWCLPSGSSPEFADRCGVLDADDCAAIGRIRDVRVRHHRRAARIALRLALSHAVAGAVPAHAWRFCRTSYGKPLVAPGLPPVHFCTSHTDTLSVVAVSVQTPVGLDAENILAAVDSNLIEAFCSTRERRALLRLPPAERRSAFTQLWTLKEAYAKLTGTGLATDFKSVAFQVATSRQFASQSPQHHLGDVSFTSWLTQTPEGPCQVSVAADAGDPAEGTGNLVCFTALGAHPEPAANLSA
jgi:4'-phosphopantetheinyl transferase